LKNGVHFLSSGAFYANGTASFEHQDWLGTERLRTTYNGGVEGAYQSLPWGDGQSFSGSDQDAHHYATLDYDSESNTDHARFRQYSSTEGRFLSPDPYGGSYNPANPQSFNRYEYAMDNPLSNIDPSGLDCIYVDEDGNYAGYDIGDCNNDTWGGGAGAYYVDCYGCLEGGVSNVSLTGDGGINFSDGDNTFYADSNGNFSQVNFITESYPAQPLNEVLSIDEGNEIILIPIIYPAGTGGGGGAPSNGSSYSFANKGRS